MRRLPFVALVLVLGLLVGLVGLHAQDGQRNINRDRPANQKWAVLIGVDQYTNVKSVWVAL